MTTKLIPDQDVGATLAPQVNLLVNGGFEIWQRGNTFTNPASVTYTADKWLVFLPGGSPTLTVSRDASVIDSETYALQVNCTSVGGIATLMIYQVVENLTGLFAGRTVSLSVRVKTSIANKIRARITDNAGGANISFSQYHSGSGNWETLTVVRTIGSSGFANIAVGIIAPDTVVTGQWWVDSAMLVFAANPMDFVPKHPADETTRCLRYYEKGVVNDALIPMQHESSICAVYTNPAVFKVLKSAVPTITISGLIVIMKHMPTTGSGEVTDTSNWAAARYFTTTDQTNFLLTRTGDQTTYPIIDWSLNWAAEVT